MTLLLREGLENQEAKSSKDEMGCLDALVSRKTLMSSFYFLPWPDNMLSEVEIQTFLYFKDQQ